MDLKYRFREFSQPSRNMFQSSSSAGQQEAQSSWHCLFSKDPTLGAHGIACLLTTRALGSFCWPMLTNRGIEIGESFTPYCWLLRVSYSDQIAGKLSNTTRCYLFPKYLRRRTWRDTSNESWLLLCFTTRHLKICIWSPSERIEAWEWLARHLKMRKAFRQKELTRGSD